MRRDDDENLTFDADPTERTSEGMLSMHRFGRRQVGENLADRIGKLRPEEREQWNNGIEKDAENEFTVPRNLSGFGAVENTQDGIAVHLHKHPQGDAHERQNDDPVEKQ